MTTSLRRPWTWLCLSGLTVFGAACSTDSETLRPVEQSVPVLDTLAEPGDPQTPDSLPPISINLPLPSLFEPPFVEPNPDDQTTTTKPPKKNSTTTTTTKPPKKNSTTTTLPEETTTTAEETTSTLPEETTTTTLPEETTTTAEETTTTLPEETTTTVEETTTTVEETTTTVEETTTTLPEETTTTVEETTTTLPEETTTTTTTVEETTTTIPVVVDVTPGEGGLGELTYGAASADVLAALQAALGAPTDTNAVRFPVDNKDGTFSTAKGATFAFQFMSRSCYSNGICAIFGGAKKNPATHKLVGWLTTENQFVSTSGMQVGTTLDAFPDLPVTLGACPDVAYTTIDGLRLRLSTTGDPFGPDSPADRSLIKVTRIESGQVSLPAPTC